MGKSNTIRRTKKLAEEVKKLQKQLNQIRKELEEISRESSPEEIVSNISPGNTNTVQHFIAKHILKQHPKFKLIIIKKKSE